MLDPTGQFKLPSMLRSQEADRHQLKHHHGLDESPDLFPLLSNHMEQTRRNGPILGDIAKKGTQTQNWLNPVLDRA
jgi:hypothetical protein